MIDLIIYAIAVTLLLIIVFRLESIIFTLHDPKEFVQLKHQS